MGLSKAEGIIFDIQEFSLQDGEGIRTTVFLKGCPLACKWCSNPEGQNFYPELLFNVSKLKEISDFESICDKGALIKNAKGNPIIRREICKVCTDRICVESSTITGLRLAGERVTAKEVFDKIKAYEVFYKNSNGGVTLSGGEPLIQHEFVRDLINLCEGAGITTGLETCGYFNWEDVKEFVHKFDFIYYDVKHLESEIHLRMTGKDNNVIAENLKKLADIIPEKITVTIPVVKGINSSNKLMEEIALLCSELKIKRVRLLPYHPMGITKYEELGKDYELHSAAAPSNSELKEIKNIFENKGLKCFISAD